MHSAQYTVYSVQCTVYSVALSGLPVHYDVRYTMGIVVPVVQEVTQPVRSQDSQSTTIVPGTWYDIFSSVFDMQKHSSLIISSTSYNGPPDGTISWCPEIKAIEYCPLSTSWWNENTAAVKLHNNTKELFKSDCILTLVKAIPASDFNSYAYPQSYMEVSCGSHTASTTVAELWLKREQIWAQFWTCKNIVLSCV